MATIKLNTTRQAIPMIYAYSTPEIARHDGWTKIGYTEQGVENRLKQQTHTADVVYKEEWRGNASYDDGSGEFFTDKDFHAYLRKNGIENSKENEWFHVDGPTSKQYFHDFRSNHGRVQLPDVAMDYILRKEQTDAVTETVAYFGSHEKGEFLWNAKPRFGKTLSVYDLCKQMKLNTILIVTNRPAIANSWYSDYVKFLGKESGYLFVSHAEALKGQPYVLSVEQYLDALFAEDKDYGRIEFVSLQDMKGSIYFGGEHNKLKDVADMNWDLLVIDEAHEGVDTYKTDVAFNKIKRKHTLHLSGTPFKALANDKFRQDAIYNWTYADEQQAKRDWTGEVGSHNPYASLPQLNLYTYQMSEIIREELSQGIEINGEMAEYAFDLNEFFAVKANGEFDHDESVNRFLDAMTTQSKFPFSSDELREELKHTFWLLNRVDSAKALAKKLKEHPVFSQYEIILAAGDGRLSEEEETAKSYDKVVKAIKEHDRTITLSVGQLTTGITIPEWSAVIMLSNIKSPALYMQAAFRSQNPWSYSRDGKFYRKENAYVFDFDPARTLIIFEQFANDLCADTSDGKGDSDTRKEHVRQLLNFFPVIGEDENGEMVDLDAEKVLSIPRKIKCQEVVRRGFMSDFLFQNISNVFHAPMEVIEIIQNFQPVAEPKGNTEVNITPDTEDELQLDENGEVKLGDEYVIGKATEIFGEKVYDEVPPEITDAIEDVVPDEPLVEDKKIDVDPLENLKKESHKKIIDPIISKAKNEYGRDFKTGDQKKFESKIKQKTNEAINHAFDDYLIKQRTQEAERQRELEDAETQNEADLINSLYDHQKVQADEQLKEELVKAIEAVQVEAQKEIVRTIETSKKEQEKKGYEDAVRDHLRGFSRTIPSFLMAYGNDSVTLANFDQIIPDEVFLEVTSITLDQFRFLRDGGPYTDAKTGKEEHFAGHLFDPIVFDDSVKEFLRLKRQLSDYFSGANDEDIFDYIPPQKTNQIFTPKWVVKKMVDMLEEENPGCFDDPDRTFIDPYMKSGMYITEIVKRLFASERMKKMFPDEKERLRHIFEHQVYGLAPTEIIYRIALAYIMGFADEVGIQKYNLRQVDALQYAKEGTLEEKLTEIF